MVRLGKLYGRITAPSHPSGAACSSYWAYLLLKHLTPAFSPLSKFSVSFSFSLNLIDGMSTNRLQSKVRS